jgi:class 3 adenylate cyclase
VAAALELLRTLDRFNGPRVMVGQAPLRARVGVSTGEVFVGNVGTYQKMDFTAVGTTVNLAARLQAEAEAGTPCISETTYENVQSLVTCRVGNPRRVLLKGLGEHLVWDVVTLREI